MSPVETVYQAEGLIVIFLNTLFLFLGRTNLLLINILHLEKPFWIG